MVVIGIFISDVCCIEVFVDGGECLKFLVVVVDLWEKGFD